MLMASQGKEIVVVHANAKGLLKNISKIVAEKGVSILSLSCWVKNGDAMIRLVSDDNLRAIEAIKKAGYKAVEEPIVMCEVPHKSGMLKHITQLLMEADLDIHHLYATARLNDSACNVVFSCSDNNKALVIINKG